MSAIYTLISNVTNWFWGLPVLIILIGGGLYLTFMIGGLQFRKFGLILKKTFGSLFDKEAQKKRLETTGVTPLQAFISAIGCTIGTGNIVGAAAAIGMGGPGALFWMWISALMAMAVKYGEVTLSIRYRQKVNGEYHGGAYMYIKEGLKSKTFATIMVVIMLVATTIVAGTHGSSIRGNFELLGLPSETAAVVCGIFLLVVIFLGSRGLHKITGVMVPCMTAFYLVCALIVVGVNIGSVPAMFVEVFKGAFSGTAAIAGFGGAALAETIRYGLARGVFSNDAGLGIQALIYAESEENKDPVECGIWAIFETFVDTIIVCSLTCFMVMTTGVWNSGAPGFELTATAMESVLGGFGRIGCIIAMILFALSSQIGICNVVKRQAHVLTGKKWCAYGAGAVFFMVVMAACLADIEKAFIFADFGNAIVMSINIIAIILLSKELRKLTKEWCDRQIVNK